MLRDRQAALIAAAVTGQIDVLQPSTQAHLDSLIATKTRRLYALEWSWPGKRQEEARAE